MSEVQLTLQAVGGPLAKHGFLGSCHCPSGYVSGALEEDSTPDVRCRVNKGVINSPFSTSSVYTSASGRPLSEVRFLWELPNFYVGGPLKKDGTPDMRYAANKQRYAGSSAPTGVSSHGPLKKNGTPDMRYAVNKQRCAERSVATAGASSHGPLKKNGTPDMRYAVNKQRCAESSAATARRVLAWAPEEERYPGHALCC